MKTKRLLIFALCVTLLVSFAPQASAAQAAGIYLADGGKAYMEIVQEPQGLLKIKGTTLLPSGKWEARLQGSHLVLHEQAGAIPPGNVGAYTLDYELQPSQTTPGDWDLLQMKMDFGESQKDLPSSPLFPSRVQAQNYRSYLHRLDDPLVVECFAAGLCSEAGKRVLSELLKAHREDPFVRVLHLNSLLMDSKFEEFGAQYAAWKPGLLKANQPLVFCAMNLAERALRAHELSAAGRNGADLVAALLSKQTDLLTRLRRLPEIQRFDQWEPAITALYPERTGEYLDIYMALKVFRVQADFLLLEGKRDQALELLVSSYYLAQLLSRNPGLVPQVAYGYCRTSCRGLETFALNACETQAEYKRLWKQLERLDRQAKQPIIATISRYPSVATDVSVFTDHPAHRQIADARFELLRMATAAKCHQLIDKQFPRSPAQFAPLLASGPPADPFTSEPLRWKTAHDALTCYSQGPDRRDDAGALVYDPTNGMLSAGDIVLRVPAKREFPFPSGGLHAKTREEVRRQFPDGLPEDMFSDTRIPYGITSTTPVLIYSYGPDINEPRVRWEARKYVPTVPYDPTNGITSPGDLFMSVAP